MDFYKVTFVVGVPAENWTEAVEQAQQIVVLMPQVFLDGAEIAATGWSADSTATAEVVARIVAQHHDGTGAFDITASGAHPKIKAIKDVRTAINVGLREAKDLVDVEWERQRVAS